MKNKNLKVRLAAQINAQNQKRVGIVKIRFEDAFGSFFLRCRTLNAEEILKLMEIYNKSRKAKTTEEYAELSNFMDDLIKILSYPNGVCLDPELNVEYWNSHFNFEVVAKILMEVSKGTSELNIKNFPKYVM